MLCPYCNEELKPTLINNPFGPGRLDALRCNNGSCRMFGQVATVAMWEQAASLVKIRHAGIRNKAAHREKIREYQRNWQRENRTKK